MLKAETDRLGYDVEKLRQRLREDIARTQAGVRLDLNLEKGRMREDVGGQELKIQEVDARIEQEIANLRTSIQASKVRVLRGAEGADVLTNSQATTLQYLVGFGERCPGWLAADTVLTPCAVTGASALLMAYLRFRL
jgi:hypothetical protein